MCLRFEVFKAQPKQAAWISLNEPQSRISSDCQLDQPASPDKEKILRGAMLALRWAIKDEADKHGLLTPYYVKSDRAIKYWLDGKATPDVFYADVLMYNGPQKLDSVLSSV